MHGVVDVKEHAAKSSEAPSGPLLEVRDLTVEFATRRGTVTAVSNVNLDVQRGSIHALIGPNGAGKTTCFNLLTKFLQPTRGTIRYDGRDITGMKPAEVARLGLVRSFQISAVFPHLSVLENVRVALQHRTPWRASCPRPFCGADTAAGKG